MKSKEKLINIELELNHHDYKLLLMLLDMYTSCNIYDNNYAIMRSESKGIQIGISNYNYNCLQEIKKKINKDIDKGV